MNLNGKFIAVTGASGGVGRAVARRIAENGGRVLAVGRNQGRLADTIASLPGEGHTSLSFDLKNTDAIPAALKSVSTNNGALQGMVHCAGIMCMRPIRMLDAVDWEQSISINLVAAGALARGFCVEGVSTGNRSIVFLSSIAGLTGHPAQTVYSATKGGLIAVSRSLAIELAKGRIRVNCVAPGLLDTGMAEHLGEMLLPAQRQQIVDRHPLGIGTGEDVANAAVFLLSDVSRWITGTTLVVDGGYSAQ